MKVFTKYLLTLLLLGIASVVNASEYEIDQKFTSVDALDGQLFAIVNETDAKAIYNVNNQNLAYDSYSSAVTGSAYLWKLHSLANEGVAELENAYAIEAVKTDGSSQSLWGMSPLYLNSGAEGGFDGCFVLGNGTQYGTDVLYGGAWEIEYEANVGFALKNVARGGYFAGVNPAPTAADPIYFTFCTLKKVEPAEPVVPLFNDGTYYLLNQATNKYLAAGSSWGTHAVVNQMGLDYILTFNDGQYTIDSQVSNGGNSHFLNGEWNDGAAFDWTFTEVAEGVYTISSGTQYLTVDGEEVHFADLAPNEYAKWTLVSAESRKNEVLAAMQNASVDNPVDISFLIKAAGFNRNDLRNNSWIRSKSGGNMTVAGPNGNLGNYGCEFWNNTFEIYQTIEDLPSGVYELTFDGFGTNGTSVLFIGGTEGAFLNTEGASNFQAALEAIANGEYTGNTTGPVTFVGGDMTFGVRRTSQVSADWTVIDNARLFYYGAASLDTYRTAWEQALEAAQAALASEDYEIVEGVERTNLQAAIDQYSQVAETQEAYEEAASALINLTNIFKAAQAAYLEFGDAQTQLAACEFRYPYASEEKLAAALEVGEMTIESAEQAQTMAAQLLMLCRQVAESSALLEGVEGSRDLTELILNPNAENGTNGWEFVADEYTTGNVSIMSNEPLTDASGNSDYRYFDGLNWGSDYWNGALQQAITLPAGKYLLTVSGRASSDVMMSVFAGEDEEMIFGEGNTGGLYGNGWNDASVEFELDEESTINIGVRGEASSIHQWMSFTRFRLAQFEGGEVGPVDPLDEYVTAYNEALAAAVEALENGDYSVVDGSERENLEEAINNYNNVEGSQAAYEEAINALVAATNAYIDAVPAYLEFGDAQTQLAACEILYPYASEEKLAAALEVGQMTIESAEQAQTMAAQLLMLCRQVAESSALLEGVEGSRDLTELILNPNAENGTNGWEFVADEYTTGNVSIMSNEPLTDASGNSDYRYFDGLNWGSDYWNGALQQAITLPAGKYLLTVSGRASSDVMMSVFAGEDEEMIFGDGNTGGLFGNGWNDASVEFELDEESTINIGVRGEASSIHQWMSFTRFRLAQFEGGDINPVIPEPEAPLGEDELIPDFFSICAEGAIPYGYAVKFGTEDRAYPNTYSGGARMFNFAEGGDFTKAIYFREGYVQYGDVKKLALEAGKKYIVHFNSAMWKASGADMTFLIYKEGDLENAVLTQTIANTPDVNGSKDAVTGSTYSEIEFTPDADGNYILKWDASGWKEVLLANPGVKVAPAKPLFADGKYYILNKGTQKYLAAGAAWGTHAVVNADGLDYAIAFADGLYTLDSNVSNGGNNHFLNGEWNDGAATGWIFTPVEGAEGLYTISNGTNFLTAQADNQVLLQDDATAEAAQWMLKTLDERIAELATATAEAPVNATFLIQDANFGRNDLRKSAWTMVANNQNLSGGNNTNNNAESYHSVFTLSQVLANAPAGKYQMTAQGFYRQDGSDNENLPVFYANDKTGTFPLKTGSENSMSEASASFTAGSYTIEPIEFTVFEDGQLTVGAKLKNNTNLWCIWDNFQLTYLGEVVNPDDPELEAPEGWTNLIANGNLANDNVESYYSKEYPSTDIVGARIVDGAGYNHSRGIVFRAGDDTENPSAQSWDSQFWIYLNKALPIGSKLHVEFDYKASQAAKASTQAHGAPGAYQHWAMVGDVNFTTEWQHFSVDVEISGNQENMESIAFNMQEEKSATDYFFDNFGIWAQLPEEIQGDWVDMLDNGDLEGDDNHNFYTSLYNMDIFNSDISYGDGVDGSRGIKVEVGERVEYEYENRFYVYLNDKLPAGTKFRMSFDYRADTPASVSTMAYAEPGNYIHWALLGNLDFDTDWQTFEYEGTITSAISTDEKTFQSAAFNLNLEEYANAYYFDNFMFQILKEHEDVIPSVTRTYPEAMAFNVENDIVEFGVNFDMPVDCGQLYATLNGEELEITPDEGSAEYVVLGRKTFEALADGEYTINLYNIHAEGWTDETVSGEFSFTFTVGQINIDPEAKAEVILADNLWDATQQGGIPEGYIVNFNEEVRTSESTYYSGPRMFVFPEGGDFTHGLYFREGYTQYGGEEDYPLYLEAGKKYTINFKSAMWKENGTNMFFRILTADGEDLVFEQTIDNNPNVNGNLDSPVVSATNTTVSFTPEEDGNYILRWQVNGFSEVLLANPTVKYIANPMHEYVMAFFNALEYAKQVRDASADCTNNEEYNILNDYINWYESEYKYFNTYNQFLEAANNLNTVAKNMQEYRRMYLEYYPLVENMLAMYQQYADTKFTQSYVYDALGWVIDEYAPNGEIRDQYNLYDLSNAYNSVKEVVTLAQDMFTEGPSRVTMTGYAVLTDRIRQGAETMRTLGIDNENLLWYADNTLDEDDWVVDEMKQSIKNDIYNKLSQPNNDLFDATIDEETGEEITPAYNMNIYVDNPNIYKWGGNNYDFSVPGWYVEDAGMSTGWTTYESWDVPADAMFQNWGGYFFTAQSIGDLPAGTYTVKFAVGERVEDTYTDSYAYVFTNEGDYSASIDYIGQTFPEFSTNNGVVTIENVVVTDGWMQFGVEAGSGSHLFFNEVQLLLTAPAPGYDYNDGSMFLMGDVNLDGEVTTSDAVATVGIVLEDWEPTYRQFRAADVNYTGNITVSDVVGVVNIALNGYEWYEELARSQSFEQEINYLTQDGNKIGLKNTTEFVAFQMDVTLTDGAMLNGVNLNQRANGLNIRYSRLEGNTYRIMAFSMNMAAITGNEGELLSLNITGNQTVTLSNIEFTDTAARAYALGVNDATGINGIMAGDANADYYTVDGVKNDKMRKGMNVVKTADGKVRKMFVK